MVRAALTGGIGSGKTAVSRLLAAHGAEIIDADLLAREVVQPGTDGLAQVVSRFGRQILSADQSLDRPALGAVVFANPAARADLEAIIHPLVRRRALELTRAAEAESDPATTVVIQVIPLLVETGQVADFDCCIVVDADPEVQRSRLMARTGLSAGEAQARIASQASRAGRLAAATWVVENDGALSALGPQVVLLWDHLVHHQPHL